MNKRTIIVIILIAGLLMTTACIEKGQQATEITINDAGLQNDINIERLKKDIRELIDNVYAPPSADVYNITKDSWEDRMSSWAHISMFGTNEVTELTKADLERIVTHVFTAFGSAKWQSDGQPRVLAEFMVTNKSETLQVRVEIEFFLEQNGTIKTILISSNL